MRQNRQKQLFRYTINVFCEGQQEKLYFDHLKDLINQNNNKTHIANIVSSDCNGSSPVVIAKTAIRLCPQTQICAVIFDNDLKNEEFSNAIDICIHNKKLVGYSNLNFNYFLILHKIKKHPSTAQIYSTNAYDMDLRNIYKLSKTDDIKSIDNIKKILNQIDLDDIKLALNNCEIISNYNKNNKNPNKTNCGNSYFDNPDFSINKIVSNILENTLKI